MVLKRTSVVQVRLVLASHDRRQVATLFSLLVNVDKRIPPRKKRKQSKRKHTKEARIYCGPSFFKETLKSHTAIVYSTSKRNKGGIYDHIYLFQNSAWINAWSACKQR